MSAVGTRWGGRDGQRFAIEEQIGSGGQALAFRVRDHQLARDVVAKVCTAREGLWKQLYTQRFERELRLTARVRGAHVIELYDCGELPSGHPYMLMELADAGSVRDLLRAATAEGGAPRGLALARALDIARELALALRDTGAARIIHRDIKPENVLVDRRRGVRLTDFGVAKDLDDDSEPLTEVGNTVGTTGYWAPEHVRGHPVPQSDVFSYGVTVYEMLYGVRPPQHEVHVAGVSRPVTTGRVLDGAWQGVPQPLGQFLRWLTAAEPADRAPDFVAVLQRLDPLRRALLADPSTDPAAPAQYTAPAGIRAATWGTGEPGATPHTGRAEPPAPPVSREETRAASASGRAAWPAPEPPPTARVPSTPTHGIGLGAIDGARRRARWTAGMGLTAGLLLGAGLLFWSPAPDDAALVQALERYEAAPSGDTGAAARALSQATGVADHPFAPLLAAMEALRAGDVPTTDAVLDALPRQGAPALTSRADLLRGAAARLAGRTGAAAAYGRAEACPDPSCRDASTRAARARREVCALDPAEAGCEGLAGERTGREAALARAAVLSWERRAESADAVQRVIGLGVDPAPGCAEGALLASILDASATVDPQRRGVLRAMGRASSREEGQCHAFLEGPP